LIIHTCIIIISAEIEEPPLIYGGYTNVRQAWVSNLDTTKDNSSAIIDLHPQVFGSRPRIDIIHENVVWQRKYRYVVSFFPSFNQLFASL
jgi:large subunit ribosomal protein L4